MVNIKSPGHGDEGLESDEFIDICFGRPPKGGHDHDGPKESKDFYHQSVKGASAPYSYPIVTGAAALRRLYPNHSLVMTKDYNLNILNLPGVVSEPLDIAPPITNTVFVPLARRLGSLPGVLIDQIEFGGWNVHWNGIDFIIYNLVVPIGFSLANQTFILHQGPEDPSRLLLIAAGARSQALHDEIWVYDQGWWQKDHSLWTEIQKADWKDVILKDEFKKALQKDVYGFFSSEEIYKELAIPWKRGLIFYGPPGNGKTISLKAIMKTCSEKGYSPLYVKSFRNWAGDQVAMSDVFEKARQLAPSVIILEDIDSLINDDNRSFFLNQVDGLSGNDGLLLIGTTNHFDRLDPGLSTRPSRFDRKYKFDDPDLEERVLYAQYWQKKLLNNRDIEFPDELVQEVANLTDKFSFAYLKETFVSTLVTLAGMEGDKPTFESLLKKEIATLRKQLDKAVKYAPPQQPQSRQDIPFQPQRPGSSTERDIRVVLDALSDSAPWREGQSPSRKIFDFDFGRQPMSEEEIRNRRDIRALLDALVEQLPPADSLSFRRYENAAERPSNGAREGPGEQNEVRDYRTLLDRISVERESNLPLFNLQRFEEGPSRRSSVNHPIWSGLRPPAFGALPLRQPAQRPNLTGADLA